MEVETARAGKTIQQDEEQAKPLEEEHVGEVPQRGAGSRDSTDDQDVADQEYVRRFRAGDSGAFERLVVRYEARLRRMAFGFVRDAQLAEDIAQDTFLQAYRRIDKLQKPASFRSWLFSIGLNRSRDELRRLAKLADGTDLEEPLRRLRSPPSTERILESRELGRWIARMVAQLPEAQRVALVLKEVSGMTYAEIASLLQVPIGTVQIRVHRGRLKLREQLRELGWRKREGGD